MIWSNGVDYLREIFAGNCDPNPSSLQKPIVMIVCKNGNDLDKRTGVIISKKFILTAMASPPQEKVCQIVKHDENAPMKLHIRESWNIINFESDESNLPASAMPQLQILPLETEIVLMQRGINSLAEPIKLIKKSLQPNGNGCLVHTLNLDTNKIEERKVSIVEYGDCITKYGKELHPLLLCIEMSPDCKHCTNLKAGSAVVCDNVLAGIVSEDASCDDNKPRICANIREARRWILNTMADASIYALANSLNIINFSLLLSLHLLNIYLF
uniref:Peptidase S1 domain-containing protein n=1 Tax=Glossina brevipalpis TaxID=37001 RepID=A0A1A9WGY4_9MUSC